MNSKGPRTDVTVVGKGGLTMQRFRLLSFVVIVAVGAVVWGGDRVRTAEPGGAGRRVEPDQPGYSYPVVDTGQAAAHLCFWRGMGVMFGSWLDVHGAGCQRSDPKDGDLDDYTYLPYGYYRGSAPQGDAIRIFNFARCVRGPVD